MHRAPGHRIGRIPIAIAALGVALLATALASDVSRAVGTLVVTSDTPPFAIYDHNKPLDQSPGVIAAQGEFCNTGTDPLEGVVAHIGDGTTPGTFPETMFGGSNYKLAMLDATVGGDVDDATRLLDILAPGTCESVYWLLVYPRTGNLTGLELDFTIWGTGYDAGAMAIRTDDDADTLELNSDISANANKLNPDTYTLTPSGPFYHGQTIEVCYTAVDFGIIGNGRGGVNDFTFQPVGNLDFNPDYWQLDKVTATFESSKCSGETYDYEDEMYFGTVDDGDWADPPAGAEACAGNSQNVTGAYCYTFVAVDEGSTTMVPYQEASSGNQEKFNGDFGASPLDLDADQGCAIGLVKSASPTDAQSGDTLTYTTAYTNLITQTVGTLPSMLQITDAIPTDTTYEGGSASCPTGVACTVYYSTNGTTYSTLEPGDATTVTHLKFVMSAAIPGSGTGTVVYSVTVNSDDGVMSGRSASSFDGGPICSESGIVTTTPVTLASFQAVREGDAVRFTWSTATETGNLGFNLYAVGDDGGMERLNDRLIPADHRDAFGPSSYELVLKGVKGDRFVVEDVDLHAKIRRHGAFDLGTAYGRPIEGEPIDWDAVHAENDALEAERAQVAASETAARVAALVADPDAVDTADAEAEGATIDAANAPRNGARRTRLARLNVDRDGIVRVTYEQLLASGVDLRGVRAADLALVNRGRSVPVRVTSVGATFGARSTIEFRGEAAQGLYTRVNAYDLVADRRLRQTIGDFKTASRLTGSPATSYQETLTIERDREYSTTAPGADPWYDVSLYTFDRPGSTVVPLPVDDAVAGTAVVTFEIAGESDVPLNPDHHVRLAIDGAVVSDTRFDGVSVHAPRVELPAERLRPDSRLTIELPGDTGAPYDFIGYNKATVIYPRAFVARDGRLSFTAAGRVFRVTGLTSADVSVYRFAGSGQAVRYDRVATQRQPDGTYAATFEGTTASARYEVVSGAPPAPAGIAPLPDGADITPSATDYLVIAHPNFIAGIAPLADHHRAAGRRVKVVDVRDVYERHAFGIVDPAAIRAYVAEARARGVRHVLLVGGDTYDYLNHAHPTAMSFIPTLYERTSSVVSHAPVDARLADGDGDGVPDVAIGRLPVKTTAELADLVAKTLGYAAKPYVRTALFASDAPDASISFADLSSQLVGLLPDGWRVARSDIEVDGVATARARLIESVNEGVALTSFVGHSGPTEWTFSGLFSSADARALANAERPTVVVQWGCWNTYHTTPYYHTLSHALLLSGNRGAAATLGASALALASSEQQLAELVIPRLAAPGATIGEAVLAAKRELARTHPQLADVLLGWNILGDPAIVVEP